jgi:hypothetical protein
LLSSDSYKDYVDACRQDTEGFQDGYRYIQLDLFSKLATADYLRAFGKAGLSLDALIMELSSPGLRFRKAFPLRYTQLLNATSGQCEPDDLIVKANLVKLTRV